MRWRSRAWARGRRGSAGGSGLAVAAAVARDVGLAAWFGGSIAGAAGLEAAGRAVDDPRRRTAAAAAGWSALRPVTRAAVVLHLTGAVAGPLLAGRRSRTAAETAALAAAAGLTAVALTATVGQQRAERTIAGLAEVPGADTPVAGPTRPLPTTAPPVAAAQRAVRRSRVRVCLATGGLVALSAARRRPA